MNHHKCVLLGSVLIFGFLINAALAERSNLIGLKPNIILVMTDDQGYGDLACHGHPYLKTPHIDRLYSQSARFTDFHTSPTCAPTRAALLSGRAPFKNGVTHTILERERMSLEATTIAEVLKKSGYTTGIFGKWHLGDADPYQPYNRGFDESFIHGAGGIGQNYPGTESNPPENGYFDPAIKHNQKFVRTKGYCTDVFFKQSLAWIKQCHNEGKPFFAYISTNAPHSPYIVAEKYKSLYVGKGSNIGKKSDRTAAFYGMITNIDDNMGLLMQKMDEWGLSQNTLLIFMTDNGTAAGDYNFGMKGRKGSMNEGGSRVPLFMRLPGSIKSGVEISRLTRHYDLFPTLADIAGAKIEPTLDLDGRSLLPLIEDPKSLWPDRSTIFHAGRWNKKGAPGRWGKGNTDPDEAKYNGFAVRNESWRLVGDALYNIDKDPAETIDLSQAQPQVVANLREVFDSWWQDVRPLMVNEDATLETDKPFLDLYLKQEKSTGIPQWEEPKL